METSALDSSNVEAAFHEVLSGTTFLVSASLTTMTGLELTSHFSTAIHTKVASREVTRGSISAVTLSSPIGPTSQGQEERKPCCKNS